MEWKETNIGWFICDMGLASIVLQYFHKHGWRVSVFGFFHETRYDNYITDLTQAKEVGLQLLIHTLEKTLDTSKRLKEEKLCAP